MTTPVGTVSPCHSKLAHCSKPCLRDGAAFHLPSSPTVPALLLFQISLSYPCVSAGSGMFPTSAVFTWWKVKPYDRSLMREISSTVASWMLTWLSATTCGIRSVEEGDAGRGELHTSVEVTRWSGFKSFSSVGVRGRMKQHCSILCRLGTVKDFCLAVKPPRARDC